MSKRTNSSSPFHNVELVLAETGRGNSRISIDGMELKGVVDVRVTAGVDDLTRVEFTIYANINKPDPLTLPQDAPGPSDSPWKGLVR